MRFRDNLSLWISSLFGISIVTGWVALLVFVVYTLGQLAAATTDWLMRH